MSTRITDGTYLEIFASASKNRAWNKEKQKMTIAKRFALHASAKNSKQEFQSNIFFIEGGSV